MGARCVRWTADTERAFLLALRMTGQVVQAAAQIGRAPGVCYDRRKRVPAFAAAWDDALAEMEGARLANARDAQAAGGEPLTAPVTRVRRDGWTRQRQRAFCRALANIGSYDKAAAQVGISRESVRRLRKRSPEFQAMCDRALIEGGATLTEAAYARAVEGWEEPVFHEGRLVGHRRRFSDGLLKSLMEAEGGATGRGRGVYVKPARSEDEILAALETKLVAAEKQLARDRKAAGLAWEEKMKREGWAP